MLSACARESTQKILSGDYLSILSHIISHNCWAKAAPKRSHWLMREPCALLVLIPCSREGEQNTSSIVKITPKQPPQCAPAPNHSGTGSAHAQPSVPLHTHPSLKAHQSPASHLLAFLQALPMENMPWGITKAWVSTGFPEESRAPPPTPSRQDLLKGTLDGVTEHRDPII